MCPRLLPAREWPKRPVPGVGPRGRCKRRRSRPPRLRPPRHPQPPSPGARGQPLGRPGSWRGARDPSDAGQSARARSTTSRAAL
eukprot:9632618-Lingulodinium_polyedra.AAC.1